MVRSRRGGKSTSKCVRESKPYSKRVDKSTGGVNREFWNLNIADCQLQTVICTGTFEKRLRRTVSQGTFIIFRTKLKNTDHDFHLGVRIRTAIAIDTGSSRVTLNDQEINQTVLNTFAAARYIDNCDKDIKTVAYLEEQKKKVYILRTKTQSNGLERNLQNSQTTLHKKLCNPTLRFFGKCEGEKLGFGTSEFRESPRSFELKSLTAYACNIKLDVDIASVKDSQSMMVTVKGNPKLTCTIVCTKFDKQTNTYQFDIQIGPFFSKKVTKNKIDLSKFMKLISQFNPFVQSPSMFNKLYQLFNKSTTTPEEELNKYFYDLIQSLPQCNMKFEFKQSLFALFGIDSVKDFKLTPFDTLLDNSIQLQLQSVTSCDWISTPSDTAVQKSNLLVPPPYEPHSHIPSDSQSSQIQVEVKFDADDPYYRKESEYCTVNLSDRIDVVRNQLDFQNLMYKGTLIRDTVNTKFQDLRNMQLEHPCDKITLTPIGIRSGQSTRRKPIRPR